MHYSGVLVRSEPTELAACAAQVESCAGADVFLSYPSASCLVAVLETETVEDQQAVLRRIQELPAVVTADLVFHRVDESGQPEATS